MASVVHTLSDGLHPSAPTTKINLTLSTAGIWHVPNVTAKSAEAASDLLTQNHDSHHIFINRAGYHNHIAHHLLTLFALGGTPVQMKRGYTSNQSYQRPQDGIATEVLKQMSQSREKFASFFGDEQCYSDFEDFFACEIQQKGIQATLDEWLFRGDDVSEALLTRIFSGYYHPLVHFGFGLEFHQAAILTESLAQAAVHDNWVAPYLLQCGKAAQRNPSSTHRLSLITCLHRARANHSIRTSPRSTDSNKLLDGVFARAMNPLVDLASRWTVTPTLSDLRFRTAEMIQASFYLAAGAHSPKSFPRFDFFFMHAANASIFFSAFVDDLDILSSFGPDATGYARLARLLEMKARYDLAIYVSRGSPELEMQRVKDYVPKSRVVTWDNAFERACEYNDDGHTAKLVRATANAARICGEFEETENWPVRGAMWLNVAHMVMDSVEAGGQRWRGRGRSPSR